MRLITAIAILATAIAGCQQTPEPPKVPLSQMNASPAGGQPGAQGAADSPSGTVLEALSAPPYTYLRLKTAAGEIWAAVPAGTFERGETVTLAGAILMAKFESKALKRTFDEVYFGTIAGADGQGAGAAAGAAPGAGTPPAVQATVGKVARAAGANARTVGEIWAQKASLEGKTVTVRAVVVKYNSGVMGKNWIHLQDGSGDPKAGTHDIAVTTLDPAAMNATITITGTVRLNRDFGAGYVYPVIVEDAKVAREM